MRRIVFQGDSVTDCGRNREAAANTPGGLGFGYANLAASRWLCEYPADGREFLNRGISGNRVVDLYARWKIDTLNLNPELISILIGVNDVWHEFDFGNGVEPERYEQIYRMLLEWTRKVLPGVKLIVMEPFALETGAVKAEFRQEVAMRAVAAKRVAADFGAAFIPFQGMFDAACRRAPADHWLGDGVHPTPAGHQLIADAWLSVAKALLTGK